MITDTFGKPLKVGDWCAFVGKSYGDSRGTINAGFVRKFTPKGAYISDGSGPLCKPDVLRRSCDIILMKPCEVPE